jgi:hypothetical protein
VLHDAARRTTRNAPSHWRSRGEQNGERDAADQRPAKRLAHLSSSIYGQGREASHGRACPIQDVLLGYAATLLSSLSKKSISKRTDEGEIPISLTTSIVEQPTESGIKTVGLYSGAPGSTQSHWAEAVHGERLATANDEGHGSRRGRSRSARCRGRPVRLRPQIREVHQIGGLAPGVESHTANVTLRPGSPLVAAVSKIAAREIGERSLAEALAFVAAQTPRL